jgi:hypothetical protein
MHFTQLMLHRTTPIWPADDAIQQRRTRRLNRQAITPQPIQEPTPMKTFIAAVAVLGLSLAAPAFAAEGNSEPFPNDMTVGTRVLRQAQAADVGSAQYPNVIGRPGSDLYGLAGDVLPSDGSEGAVQTANSLPRGAEEGTVTYAQAQSVNHWVLAHSQAVAIRTASR